MLKIVFDGCPISQARARHFVRNGKNMCFDPQAQLKKVLKIKAQEYTDIYACENDGFEMFKYPLLDFFYMMPIPTSMCKKMREIAKTGLLRHVKKPDVDNLVKLSLDVLTGIAYQDDNCVAIGKIYKLYSTHPRSIILIREMDKILTKEELASVSMRGMQI